MKSFKCTCGAVHLAYEWNWATAVHLESMHNLVHGRPAGTMGDDIKNMTHIEKGTETAWYICPTCDRQVTARNLVSIDPTPLYEPPKRA